MEIEEEKIKQIFLLLSFLSVINQFNKCDINLPLFIFAYLIWNNENDQKLQTSCLIIFSSLIDLIYLLTFAPFYSQLTHNKQPLLDNFTLLVTSVIMLAKIIVFYFIVKQYPQVQHGFTFEGFKDNVTQLFSFNDNS